MEERLVPLNAVLALVSQDGAWFGDLAAQGFRLHALELDVQSSPGVVRADAVLYRLDPNLILLVECKSGRNVEERQARSYMAATPEGIRSRSSIPNEMMGCDHVQVSPLYVCLDKYRRDVQRSLRKLRIEVPVCRSARGEFGSTVRYRRDWGNLNTTTLLSRCRLRESGLMINLRL